MALLNPAATLPTSSRDAQEMFDERYNAAQLLVQPATWASELGEEHTTPALETKYPMSVLGLKFTETKAGEGKFKTIGEKECTLTTAEYDEGVEIELVKLCSNSFSAKRWADAPAAFVQAEQMFKLKLIADALIANTETCGWDDLALFHDSHLCNPKDAGSSTFDNYQATTKDVADITDLEEEITLMANVLDVNGDRLGVRYALAAVKNVGAQAMHTLVEERETKLVEFVVVDVRLVRDRLLEHEMELAHEVERVHRLRSVQNRWRAIGVIGEASGCACTSTVAVLPSAPMRCSLTIRWRNRLGATFATRL